MTLDLFPNERPSMIAGVDEAGRGPLAGPVVAAAVILDPDKPIQDLDDSKILTEKKRDVLALKIRQQAKAWCVAWSDEREIDEINILQATMQAMVRALVGLPLVPETILIDGNRCPDLPPELEICPIQAIVGGDGLEPAISAASILAKVHRDQEMYRLDRCYPGYGFAKHKGYATRQHLKVLRKLGPTPVHRKSFSPCQPREDREIQQSVLALDTDQPSLPL